MKLPDGELRILGPTADRSHSADQSNSARQSSTVFTSLRRVAQSIAVVTCLTLMTSARSQGQQAEEAPSEESMALYADAANFQTGGAIDVAIETWNKFLKQYPKHPMSAEAAHFLGVCYMQKDPPDYEAASNSFARALNRADYELREESLVNYGWCLYASAGEGEQKDSQRLRKTIETFGLLVKEFPDSQFLDRAYFYGGEAAYGLGQTEKAIEFYNRLLSMPKAAESPLHCDALYARGVAFEELQRTDQAVSSYKQLLASCERDELANDVRLRIGDLMILNGDYPKAIEAFDQITEDTGSEDDRAYALFRQAYALVQSGKSTEAAAAYDRLLAEYPNSQYAASAVLASAQSSYRGGDMGAAEEKFRKVLGQNNPIAATEATHWLARIYLTGGKAQQAIRVTREQMQRGVQGEFANDVRLDLAEALAAQPDTVEESMDLFEKIYRDNPADKLAPRALYNAAFSALQLGQPQRALELALEFIQKFPKDTLVSDLRFVAAESQLATNQPGMASDTYKHLLATSDKQNIQRPLWVLRAGVASNAAERWDQTVSMLGDEIDDLPQPAQKAEAFQLIGQAHLQADRARQAADAFRSSLQADPGWQRADQSALLLGQALLAAGDQTAANRTWQELIDNAANQVMADQARYRVAQLATSANRFADAIEFYDQILQSNGEPRLVPYAQYGRGWALLQREQYQPAFESLDQMLKENDEHPLRNDAVLARGIALRNLGRLPAARKDLQQFLDTNPDGINLGHALYELALVDQQEKQPSKAAEKLEKLVRDVPDYPTMDQVLYELGWSLQESGDEEAAIKYFDQFIRDYPDHSLVAEAAYFIGQQYYSAKRWKPATEKFLIAARKAKDSSLSEKAYYRLGWSHFNLNEFDEAENAFAEQATAHPNGSFAFDAQMMIGESRFKQKDFEEALAAYDEARNRVRSNNDTSKSIRDDAERQIRELVFLHGGQSAAQLKRWDDAISWYDELRERFPTTKYLPQVFYETGFAYQQKGDSANGLRFFQEVADNYRNELAARARFMMGEIHFANRDFDKAIPEFQRVMYGFGADQAPDRIKNWQAKSGFEAARCSELLMQSASTNAARDKSLKLAQDFYNYVLEKHPRHELAVNARQRLGAINR